MDRDKLYELAADLWQQLYSGLIDDPEYRVGAIERLLEACDMLLGSPNPKEYLRLPSGWREHIRARYGHGSSTCPLDGCECCDNKPVTRPCTCGSGEPSPGVSGGCNRGSPYCG